MPKKQNPQKNNQNSGWKVLLPIIVGIATIALVVTAGLAVYFLFTNYYQPKPSPPKTVPKNTNQSVTNSNKNKTANEDGWPIFESKEYYFSFAHPPGTKVNRHALGNGMSTDGYLISGKDNFEQSVWVYRRGCDARCFDKDIVRWHPKTKLKSEAETINGLPAHVIYFDENGKVKKQVYLRSDLGAVVYFEFTGLDSAESSIGEARQKILESFRFE
ncbi:MAG: hypothetical protein FJZ04_00675 [Candidatus Moranbacteria bacterium]|nr:hypothetical protein [Candidatus Moranbacteria bacterium]